MKLETVEPVSAAIELKLSSAQILVIWSGLNHIICAYQTREAVGRAITAYPFQLVPLPPELDSGTFSQEMMNRVGSLWTKLKSLRSTGGKVQLDSFELRAAAYSARTSVKVARMEMREARKEGKESTSRTVAAKQALKQVSQGKKQVIDFLERYMKRAERLLRKTAGSDQQKALSKEWRSHLRWIVFHLAYFKPYRIPGRSARQMQIQWVEELVKMAEAAILIRRLKLPAPDRLRKVIRQFLFYSRRGRIARYHHVYMLRNSNKPFASARLFEFIEPRLYLEKSK